MRLVLKYGDKARRVSDNVKDNLDVAEKRLLRITIKISWKDKVTNKVVLKMLIKYQDRIIQSNSEKGASVSWTYNKGKAPGKRKQ